MEELHKAPSNPDPISVDTGHALSKSEVLKVVFIGLLFVGVMIGIVRVILPGPQSLSGYATSEADSALEKMRAINRRMDQISLTLEGVDNVPPENVIGQEMARLRIEHDNRLKTLESAISNEPERVLSVPLLRKDLELLAARISSIQEATHNDVERLYSVMLWFLGAVVTVSVAGLGLGVAHLRRPT